ncbi:MULTISPECIES: phage holin [Virgibacillus]|uniref:Holin, SPP1 family n=2 Tax=Virgibacillus TaxID=84406 RepID=A0A024QDH4_9BACI|nr:MULTISPECIES: phage holin [Virgibacillus]EQB35654.1 holin [Virgibacillus sp. CM-4]MYL42447.1 phage holin [Virgibacillus massiliensis]GGJ42391.1 holin [Virgibacillus kapii]CDQ40312.1 holin, SPP1 family [Virgibacillus massiliensis]
MDKGTVFRTIALLIALTNQILVIFGKSPLPINSELLEELMSVVFTIGTAVIAWFKNNYVTRNGAKQKQILHAHGLAASSKKGLKS